MKEQSDFQVGDLVTGRAKDLEGLFWLLTKKGRSGNFFFFIEIDVNKKTYSHLILGEFDSLYHKKV